LNSLNKIAEHDAGKNDALKRLRIEYEDRIRQLEATEPDHKSRRLRLFSSEYERFSREGLKQERNSILQLRNQDVINDEVLRRIQTDIDLAEARLRRHQ
jgi:monovalent cation/hydrogen antiporter